MKSKLFLVINLVIFGTSLSPLAFAQGFKERQAERRSQKEEIERQEKEDAASQVQRVYKGHTVRKSLRPIDPALIKEECERRLGTYKDEKCWCGKEELPENSFCKTQAGKKQAARLYDGKC